MWLIAKIKTPLISHIARIDTEFHCDTDLEKLNSFKLSYHLLEHTFVICMYTPTSLIGSPF